MVDGPAGHRRGQRPVVPSERVETIGEYLHEARVAVYDRQPGTILRALWNRAGPPLRVAPIGRHGPHFNARALRELLFGGSDNRMFTRKQRETFTGC